MPSGRYTTYTVKKGDTLAKIASLYKSSVSAIAAASGISDPNRIEVGQELFIPVKAAATASSPKTPPQSLPAVASGQDASPSVPDTSAGTPAGIAAWFQAPRVWFTIATIATVAYTLWTRNNRR